MEALIARLEKIIGHLPGPGKLIFGALVSDRQSFSVLIACMVAVAATYLQPPVFSLYTPILQQGLRDPGSSAPLYVAAAYLLLAVLTLVGGASGDIFGRKRFLIVGMIGVLLTNVAGVFTVNTPIYIWVNTLNTISNVLILPMTIAIVTIAFPLQVRPFAYGAIFAAQSVALVLSSSINGIAVLVNLQWAAFLPAIAVCIVAFRLIFRDLSESRAPIGTSRVELFLNVVWAAAIFSLVYGVLIIGGGFNERNIFLIVTICILGFIIGYRWIARRMQMRGATLRLYNVRDLSLAIFAGIMLSVGQSSFLYQIGTFFQKIQGVGPVIAGARLLPFVLALMLATFAIVRLSMRFGARRLISGGFAVMAVGTGLLVIIKPDTPYWQLILPFAIMGFGFGVATVARTVVVLTAPPPGIVGMAAGINSAAGQSGFALGTVISSFLVTYFADQHFMQQLQAANAPQAVMQLASDAFQNVFARVISGNLTLLPESLESQVTILFAPSFSVGLSLTYLVVAGLLGITAAVVFFGMTRGLRGTLTSQPFAGPTAAEPAKSAPETAETA